MLSPYPSTIFPFPFTKHLPRSMTSQLECSERLSLARMLHIFQFKLETCANSLSLDVEKTRVYTSQGAVLQQITSTLVYCKNGRGHSRHNEHEKGDIRFF